MRGGRWLGVLLIGGLIAAMLIGCGGKVSKSNYEKIKAGMTQKQVEDILGKGQEKAGVGGAIGDLAGSAKVITWKDDGKQITVTFVNDKVTVKAQEGL